MKKKFTFSGHHRTLRNFLALSIMLLAFMAVPTILWADDVTVTINIASFTDLPTGTATYNTYNWTENSISGKATIYANSNSTSMQFNASNYLFYSTVAVPGVT